MSRSYYTHSGSGRGLRFRGRRVIQRKLTRRDVVQIAYILIIAILAIALGAYLGWTSLKGEEMEEKRDHPHSMTHPSNIRIGKTFCLPGQPVPPKSGSRCSGR